MTVLPSPCIDAHQHFWHYTAEEFDWLDEPMAQLRRDFLPEQLEDVAAACGVSSSIAVQARPTLEENDFLLGCAERSSVIAGVVGWIPLRDADVSSLLDRYAARPTFCGVREMFQAEPAGCMEGGDLDRGLREITVRNLSFDLLLRRDQLPEATQLVDRHPLQRFILDHAAKPAIRNGEREPWESHLRELAQRPNVSCKISGFVTEANWESWTLAKIRPYLDVCVEAFGPSRLLAGSDWPVCLVAADYKRWWSTLEQHFAAFSSAEREQVFAGTAIREYRLQPVADRSFPR